MKKVMIVAAHPDDEVLGCGGLISKYINKGVEFKVLFVGEGSSCRFDDPLGLPALASKAQREASAIQALQTLGVKEFEFNDMPCGRFNDVPIIEINKIIEKSIAGFCPDTVFTHSSSDANYDHGVVFKSTLMATRPTNYKSKVLKLLSYETPSSSEWAFSKTFAPNVFERLDSVDIDLKWQALSCYQTEIKPFPFPRSLEGIRTFAMMRGMQAGFEYAEAFQLIREFKP